MRPEKGAITRNLRRRKEKQKEDRLQDIRKKKQKDAKNTN